MLYAYIQLDAHTSKYLGILIVFFLLFDKATKTSDGALDDYDKKIHPFICFVSTQKAE